MREMILQEEGRVSYNSIRYSFHFPEFIYLWRQEGREGGN